MDKGYICVFGASSPDLDVKYVAAARELGQEIARRGYGCINGGGRSGLMRAASDGCLDAGGKAMGIIPQFMVDNGWHYDRLTSLIRTADMHERKSKMQELSVATVALPGGLGTFEELTEVLTWRQLNIVVKPIVILNVDHYYDHLIALFDHAVNHGFIPQIHRDTIINVATTAQQALDIIERQLAQGCTDTPPKFHS